MKIRLGLCLIGIILSLSLPGVQAKAASREFIIDTDVGMDDAIAILYLLKRPDITVKAITIEGDGNAHCKAAFANLQGLLKLVHRTGIPAACGRPTPLAGNHQFPQKVLDLCDRLAGTPLDKPQVNPPQQTAKNLLITTLRSSSHPIDILAIGPLTTIAEAFDEQPNLKNKIRMIYQMGGAIRVPGNIQDVNPKLDNKVAEWNIYIDPLAAQKVFHSGVPMTLVPLDVTNQVPIDYSFYQHIKKNNKSPGTNFIHELLDRNKKWILSNTWYFWDPMAAVIASDESIAIIEKQPLTVILQPESQSGATVIDTKNGAPIRVVTKINVEKFKTLLLDTLNK